MSSSRSITGARQRRAGEAPPTINRSNNSQQAFSQQKQYVNQPVQQKRVVQEPVVNDPNGINVAGKMSIPKAFTLVTIRLGRLEQYIQQLQEEGTLSQTNTNNYDEKTTENMRLIESSVINNIVSRIDNLEKNAKQNGNDKVMEEMKSHISKLDKDLRETKDLLMMVMMKQEKMVLEVDDKLLNIHETFDKQYSDLLNNINYSDNEISNEECITIDDEDKRIHGHELQETDINQNENITINLKEIIENELNDN